MKFYRRLKTNTVKLSLFLREKLAKKGFSRIVSTFEGNMMREADGKVSSANGSGSPSNVVLGRQQAKDIENCASCQVRPYNPKEANYN